MIRIKTLEIAGMRSVLEALRLPFGKECRSCVDAAYDYNDGSFVTKSSSIIDDRDLHLLSVLVGRGDEHSKVLREMRHDTFGVKQIRIELELNASQVKARCIFKVKD